MFDFQSELLAGVKSVLIVQYVFGICCMNFLLKTQVHCGVCLICVTEGSSILDKHDFVTLSSSNLELLCLIRTVALLDKPQLLMWMHSVLVLFARFVSFKHPVTPS